MSTLKKHTSAIALGEKLSKQHHEKSTALAQAMMHVKEFMTDTQKAIILLREGKVHLDAGDVRGALECFSQGIIYNPTVGLFNYRAICHKQMDMYNDAYFDYSYNIRLEPENGMHYCNRGLVLARLKKFQLSIEDLNSAIEYEPSAANYYARACVYSDFGRFTNAVADFTSALNEDPTNISNEFRIKCTFRRAQTYFDIQQYEDAIRDATDVLMLDAVNVNARALLGKAYKIIHEYQKAEEHLTNAILIENDQAHLYAERGDIRFRTGQKNKIVEAVYDFDVAVKLLEQRLGLSKDSADSLQRMILSVNGLSRSTQHTLQNNNSGNNATNNSNSGHAQVSSTASVAIVHTSSSSSPSNHQHQHQHTHNSSKSNLRRGNSHGHGSHGHPHAQTMHSSGDDEHPNNNNNLHDGDEQDEDFWAGYEDSNADSNPLPAQTHGKRAHHSGSGHRPRSRPMSKGTGNSSSNANNNGGVGNAVHGNSANTNSATSNGNSGAVTMAALPAAMRRDIEEQLAETLYKRAQSKMLLPAHDDSVIESALADAWRAIQLSDEDDDFHLMAATCLIRLHRYPEAVKLLEHVLQVSPQNFKAMYNLSFCRRAEGYQKDAIENLTKIISVTQEGSGAGGVFGSPSHLSSSSAATTSNTSSGNNGNATAVKSFPIHRVFEMRGTLFHEAQAHKLALADLGKAIAINPAHAENYFLRADCHYKLGEYELAVQDYDQAEQKGFVDRCALLLSRGMVYRLLKDNEGALLDFRRALELLRTTSDVIGVVRGQSFIAFCLLDLGDFVQAYAVLEDAAQENEKLVVKCEQDLQALHNPTSEVALALGYDALSTSERDQKKEDMRDECFYCKRVSWILRYHMVLCMYMEKHFEQACALAVQCVDEEAVRFIPDDHTEGTLHFFFGQIRMALRQAAEALQLFEACARTSWVRVSRHAFLCSFASAKALQCLSRHREALVHFDRAVESQPENPFVFFRRAWSHKALGDFVKAGDDFETAKHLSANNPNFAVDYKRIARYEYMEIADEPDLVEPFPSLLPVPGLQFR